MNFSFKWLFKSLEYDLTTSIKNMPHIPVYTHYSSNTSISPIRRVTATDISIREEAEPCELHDRINCELCAKATKIKMDQVLKRSISSNAVNNIKKRQSLVNLRRTLSQTSCYSTESTDLNDESFNELLFCLSGDNNYDLANTLWDMLPKEINDLFIERLRTRRKHKSDKNLDYKDFRNVFHTGKEHGSSTTTKNRRKKFIKSHSRTLSAIEKKKIINEIVNVLYDDLLNDDEADYIDSENTMMENYEKYIIPKRLSKKILEPEESNTCSNQHPTTTSQLLQDEDKLDKKIKELNVLIERLEQFSPLPTPATDKGQTLSNLEATSQKIDCVLQSPRQPHVKTQISNVSSKPTKNSGLINYLATKSKHLMNRFRHKKKKKPAAQNLYRSPDV